MTAPKHLSGYPPHYMQAVEQAFALGELVIPCVNSSPASVRMQFYGFLRALRNEGKAELADSVSILTETDKGQIRILRKESAPVTMDIAAALQKAHPALSTSPAVELDDINAKAADFLKRLGS